MSNSPLDPADTEFPRIKFYRSWLSVLPQLLFAALAAAVVAWATVGTTMYALPLRLFGEQWIALPLFLLILGVLCVRPLILLLDAVHTVGVHHIYSTQGRISWHRHALEIPFEDVLGVRVHQTMLERILNVGTVLVWTATAERPDLQMKGLRNPTNVMHVIRERVDAAIIARGSHHQGRAQGRHETATS